MVLDGDANGEKYRAGYLGFVTEGPGEKGGEIKKIERNTRRDDTSTLKILSDQSWDLYIHVL